MLALIVEIFLEFLLQVVVELVFDVFLHLFPERARRSLSTILTAGVYFGVGLFVGWVSLWFFPKAFVRSESFHGISLVIAPVLAGLAMAAIGMIRARRGKVVTRLESFSYGFLLAFGIALVRFWYTE